MPFVTEAIWDELGEKEQLITAPWPEPNPKWNFDAETEEMQRVMELIRRIRSLRAESNVDARKKIHAVIYAHDDIQLIKDKTDVITRLANLGLLEVDKDGEKIDKALSAFVGDIEIYLPLADLIDLDQEKARISKEMENVENYLVSLGKKLGKESFIKNAPKEVIEKEQAKLKEAKSKLEKLAKQLQQLGD